MALEKVNLEKWKFALGEKQDCLAHGREVNIPHTWNVETGVESAGKDSAEVFTEDFTEEISKNAAEKPAESCPEKSGEKSAEEYWGIGWYSTCFVPEKSWEGKRIQVLFRAVYHDACVYLNGKEIGAHRNSGYTPFVAELTEGLHFGTENQLTVRVDNRFSQEMLPYERSFDWPNDGGLIRPAELLITGKSFIKNPGVISRPVITSGRERQDQGSAVFGLRAQIDGEQKGESVLEWQLFEGCDGEVSHPGAKSICEGRRSVSNEGAVEIPGRILTAVKYWHFDSPCLYTLKLFLREAGELLDEQSIVFGFRDFHVQGSRFFLNGEPVRLPGTEWMPGSDPSYGMAEPKEQLEKMLGILKGSGSILTRFHWQQDDWVFDWCDRHGMLVQEEVPFWGKCPPKAGKQQWKVFRQQIEEMVAFHRNHPSIIAWGVGNELDAKCPETVQYIRDAVAYTHSLDPERLANYVTNTIFDAHSADGARDGDVIMVNDYIGTWHQGYDQYQEWDAIVKSNPGKPLIPSEFGLCEPAFSGGDERREAVFLEKMECYRKYPDIAGTVYFCLNDYRTQIGEEGEGRYKKRVHGSTGLCGETKPSYLTVRREYSPILLREQEGSLMVQCRDDIPSYTVKGYFLKIQGEVVKIPVLKPGETWTLRWDGQQRWNGQQRWDGQQRWNGQQRWDGQLRWNGQQLQESHQNDGRQCGVQPQNSGQTQCSEQSRKISLRIEEIEVYRPDGERVL